MTTLPRSPVTSRRFASNPTTPNKPRKIGHEEQSPSMVGGFEGSPTSTFSSPTTPGTASTQVDGSQSSLGNILASAALANSSSTPGEFQRRLYVRSDPALLTCFDPADKELYDLWAPKR